MTKTDSDCKKNENPLLTASLINKLFFWWMKDLFIYGSKYDLEEKDLYRIMSEDQSATLKIKLHEAWSQEYAVALARKETPSLWKCLIKVFKWKFIRWSILCLFFAAIQIMQPLLLEQIVSYFQPSSRISTVHACSLVGVSIMLSIICTISTRAAAFNLMRLGLNIRISCSSLIYNKLLRLSSSSIDKNTSISVINLLSTDVSKFEAMMCYLPFLVTIPLQAIFATYFIYQYVGIIAAIVGFVSIIFQAMPLQVIYYKCITKLRAQQAAQTDKRISLISEVINGILAVKMYVWENYFIKLAHLSRKEEMNVFFKISYFKTFIVSSLHSAQRACTFLVVATYTLQNGLMTVNKLIPVAQFIVIMKEHLMGVYNLTIRCLADGNISIKRIESFLLREELVSNVKSISAGSNEAISMNNVATKWDTKKSENTISDVNFEIERNQLSVMFGSVGAGKTTILQLIMGELPLTSGEIHVQGKISYASQAAWIFNGSIRDNIIFGEKYCEEKYNRVVKACALVEDFSSLPSGDKTFVGDKGTTLSGGQCARVNLARAVYRDADIYLLDDPLSAVDTRVAGTLLKDCIKGLLKDKTRILVTHNIQVLSQADKIILLNKGLIQYQGTFADFQLSENYSTYFSSTEEKSSNIIRNNSLDTDDPKKILDLPENESKEHEPQETEELLAKGGVSKSIFLKYVQYSKSHISIIILILSSLMVVLLCCGFDYWMITWTQNRESFYENGFQNHSTISNNLENLNDFHTFLYMAIGFVISIISFSVIKNLFFHNFALSASTNIHNKMFGSLVGAPLKFFQTNPPGRILNRFSEDTLSVDDFFTQAFLDTLEAGILASVLILPVLIMNKWHIISLLIYSFLNFEVYKLCVPTIRGTKRLAGAAISPILSCVNSSLVGAATIRSHGAEKVVDKDFDTHLDRFTTAYLLHIASAGALRTWVDLLVPILFGLVTYSFFVFKNDANVAGYIGLSIMQVLNMSMIVSFFVKTLSDTLSYSVNLERMFQFIKLDQEKTNEKESFVKPPLNWPTQGELKFDHLYLRYSNNLEPALQDINLTIEPGMKIGIVGRTGAGKSSLISALFRTVDIDGTISIDGIDTKKVSLPELRSKISIIPQEPMIFNASLRSNLDPFNEFEDAVLWSALSSTELKDSFLSLDCLIDRGGQNLSLGQRQLLCLARAIIRKTKILVLDEATASVDNITDNLIQKTIRDKFENCTVLTVAHRLNSIMDNDRVIVMKNGQVVEYDHPHILLQKNGGHFWDMVEQAGADMSKHLKEIAEKAYRKKEKQLSQN